MAPGTGVWTGIGQISTAVSGRSLGAPLFTLAAFFFLFLVEAGEVVDSDEVPVGGGVEDGDGSLA